MSTIKLILVVGLIFMMVQVNAFGSEPEAPVIESSFGIEMIRIPAGVFMMGSPENEAGRHHGEVQHEVTLTRDFYLARYEVTAQQWAATMGGEPVDSRVAQSGVTLDDAFAFCNALSVLEGLTPVYTIEGSQGKAVWNPGADGYRLPTEAEWEYACRAGSTEATSNGAITQIYHEPLDPTMDAVAWYRGNRSRSDGPTEVGLKQANAWGLYDMHGNVAEWVWDLEEWFTGEPQVDPVDLECSGLCRGYRGGSWRTDARYCRSASRQFATWDYAPPSIGLRLARSIP